MTPQQRRSAARKRQRAALMKVWIAEAEDPWLHYAVCEVQWDRGCTGRAVDGHEPVLRSQGGSVLYRQNVLLCCRHCHDKCHEKRAEARLRGFIIHQEDR